MSEAPGERLRSAREGLGLTRAELAELAGLSTSTIYRIETDGEYRVNRATAALIADALYVQVRDLFHPRHLSHLGRPPQTGTPIGTKHELDPADYCPTCGLALPATARCEYCD